MRAVVCHAYGDYHELKVEDFPAAALGAGQVRIAVELASVSFALKLWISGQYQHKVPLPFVPGTELVGRIVEVGDGVTHVATGQRVLAIVESGGWGEDCVTRAETVYPIPDGLDSGAALHLGISYGTAYGALHWRARLQPGETLLVLAAAGAVGLAAVELGALHGAKVIAAAGGGEKCAVAAAHGASTTIDYTTQDLRSVGKTDVVFDPVGGPSAESAMRTLAAGGRHVVIGFASGKVPAFPANILLVKNVSVQGFNFGAYVGWSADDQRARHAPRLRETYAKLFAWAVEGKLKPQLSRTWPLEEFVAAMDALQSRGSQGKLALRIAPGGTP